MDFSVGLDDISLVSSLANGNTTNNFGMKLDLSDFRIGLEGSTTTQWDNTTETTYTNVSFNGWSILAIYMLITTGQPVQSTSYSYQY